MKIGICASDRTPGALVISTVADCSVTEDSVPITASFENPIFPSMPFEILPSPKIYGFGPVSRPRVRGKRNQKKGVI